MRLVSLADVLIVQTKPCSLKLPSHFQLDLNRQSCLFLAHHKSDLTSLYESLSTKDTLVISCLPDAFYLQGQTIVLEPESMSMLLFDLRKMVEGRLCGDRVLDTLVVDNISVFTWEVECLTPENYKQYGYDKPFTRPRVYGELSRLLNDLKQMYKCNVIVTSYDVQFERGYDCDLPQNPRTSLEEFLLLPIPFLMSHDVIIHVNSGVVHQIDKSTGKMIIYETTEMCSQLAKEL